MTRNVFRIAAWAALAAIIYVTVSPIELRPHDVLSVGFDRALAFSALAALFVLAYPRQWMFVGLAVVVGALGIELLQELSPTRHARLNDALVKAAGALVGVIVGWMLNALLDRWRRTSLSAD